MPKHKVQNLTCIFAMLLKWLMPAALFAALSTNTNDGASESILTVLLATSVVYLC